MAFDVNLVPFSETIILGLPRPDRLTFHRARQTHAERLRNTDQLR